jgi:hypothetical protein
MDSLKIEDFGFGWISVGGKRYSSDLVIYPDGRVEDAWRRSRGHRLKSDDIKELIESHPEVIIAGTGVSGMVTPDDALETQLARRGITFEAIPNEQAVRRYNALIGTRRVGCCFHLTC